jgi:ABC-type branched-subunit amino acid transport system substrate-binding protein
LPQFIGSREWDTKDFEKFLMSNPELSASYPSVQAADTTGTYNTFIDAYYNKYGENAAEPSGAMAAAFDAYLIMIKGFEDAYDNLQNMDMEEFRESAGTDAKGRALVQTYETALQTGIPAGVHIRDAIKEISDFEGATGILSYDGNTEVNKTVTILHFFKGTKMDPYTVEDDKTITGDDTPLTEVEEIQN